MFIALRSNVSYALGNSNAFVHSIYIRYLRRRFRIYLENNDEGNLLLFWEYAEDFKLCHSTTHRFEQHDRSRPICINGQQAWPHDYQCSPAESKAFAVFIFNTFLAQGAQHPLHSEKISADQVEAVNILLQKAPRTLFVSLQASVMRELMQLFYQDFARAQRYREYFVAASMDLFGCFEVKICTILIFFCNNDKFLCVLY